MERKYYEQLLIISSGKEFEKKCQELLREKYGPKFIIIRPYGKFGDRKNDGYIEEENTFYQIFGPEEKTVSSEKQAINKIYNDYIKLKEHCENKEWNCEIKKFVFIYNDKKKGRSPELEKKRKEIEEHNVKCEIFGIQELMEIYDSLSNEQKIKLINYLEKPGNNRDKEIYLDLKEKFYTTGLIDKLENFIFGQPFDINYFDLPDGTDSSEYVNYVLQNPFYVFKDEKLEKLKNKFLNNYENVMWLLGTNYFPTHLEKRTIMETTYRHKTKEKVEEFMNYKADAVGALKILLREGYLKGY